MDKSLKNFSFPYTNQILIFSTTMIFLPVFMINILDIHTFVQIGKMIILIPTFLATIGFIYCILSFHFRTIRGDELKLRIHLESLNVSFASTLIALFIFAFVFLNFIPKMLNWIMVILAIVAIVSYLMASGLIKDKYQ